MHHVVLESWSRQKSFLHERDPRVKILTTIVFLVVVATTPVVDPRQATGYAVFLLAALLLAHLPAGPLLARAAVVLPFTGTFAILSALNGDPERSVALLVKSYYSAVAVLLLVGTTPLPRLLHAMERLGIPRMLVLVVQFLYRYLFVISEQAQHMRLAARCRGDVARRGISSRNSRFRAAAGALAVLFGRSYQRAEAIHRAMLSRGFSGKIRPLRGLSLQWADYIYLATAVAILVMLRFGGKILA